MVFDHLSLPVRELAQSRAFFQQALAPLGIGVAAEYPGTVGLGRDDQPQLWLAETKGAPTPLHLAFVAANRAEVDAFHAAALLAGAIDNGTPGLRPQYHANYYAAFVLDPDGHNIEAVCHQPDGGAPRS